MSSLSRHRARRRLQTVAPSGQDGAAKTVVESQPVLARFFRVRGADGATVDDLTQETYRRLYERMNREDLSEIRNVEHYLKRIAGNIWREHLRRRTRPVDAGQVEYVDEEYASEEFSPERVYEERMAEERVLAAISDLPQRTRRVFMDFHIRGLPQKEIAGLLGISVSAVEKHVVKAKTAICLRLREPE